MPDLTKTRTVFSQSGTGHDPNGNENRFIDFVTEREDCWDPAIDRHFGLPRDVWEDMGRPPEITVTIEPGDLLNVDNVGDTLAAAATMSPDELRKTLVENDGRIPLGGETGTTDRAFNEAEGDRSE